MFYSARFALNVAIFTLTMRFTFTFFYIQKQKKTSKLFLSSLPISVLRNLECVQYLQE